MTKLFIFGDVDTSLAMPVRFSENPGANANEKLWAEFSISDRDRTLSFLRSKFGTGNGGVVNSCAQRVIEILKMALDDGDLADMSFSLVMYDWHVAGSVTTFSRSLTRPQ